MHTCRGQETSGETCFSQLCTHLPGRHMRLHPMLKEETHNRHQLPGGLWSSSMELKRIDTSSDALAELIPVTHQPRKVCIMVTFVFKHEPRWRPKCWLLRVSPQALHWFALDLPNCLRNKCVCVFQQKRNKRKKKSQILAKC